MKIISCILFILFFQRTSAQLSVDVKPLGQEIQLAGFKIISFKDSATHHEVIEVLTLLKEKLMELSKIIPTKQFVLLQQVPIWVEYKLNKDGAVWYHKSKEWVVANGYPAEIAKCVEICNMKHFLEWQKLNQPFMVLHELAHAYHDRVLGSLNKDVFAAYANAVNTKIYDSVAYNLGGKRKAYALNNADEYFAELTEAYLGQNDFFPYNRSQLQTFDPMGYALMKKVWE